MPSALADEAAKRGLRNRGLRNKVNQANSSQRIVYALIDAAAQPFYVGQTANQEMRLSAHRLTYGREIRMDVLESVAGKLNAHIAERLWISRMVYRRVRLENYLDIVLPPDELQSLIDFNLRWSWERTENPLHAIRRALTCFSVSARRRPYNPRHAFFLPDHVFNGIRHYGIRLGGRRHFPLSDESLAQYGHLITMTPDAGGVFFEPVHNPPNK